MTVSLTTVVLQDRDVRAEAGFAAAVGSRRGRGDSNDAVLRDRRPAAVLQFEAWTQSLPVTAALRQRTFPQTEKPYLVDENGYLRLGEHLHYDCNLVGEAYRIGHGADAHLQLSFSSQDFTHFVSFTAEQTGELLLRCQHQITRPDVDAVRMENIPVKYVEMNGVVAPRTETGAILFVSRERASVPRINILPQNRWQSCPVTLDVVELRALAGWIVEQVPFTAPEL